MWRPFVKCPIEETEVSWRHPQNRSPEADGRLSQLGYEKITNFRYQRIFLEGINKSIEPGVGLSDKKKKINNHTVNSKSVDPEKPSTS
jgi:hypothetical protein